MTTTQRGSATDKKAAQQPPWKVLLLNDDHHEMGYVVNALCKAVPGLEAAQAARIMLEAHLKGIGLVTVCPKEQAEYFRDRIQTFGLGCSFEPD